MGKIKNLISVLALSAQIAGCGNVGPDLRGDNEYPRDTKYPPCPCDEGSVLLTQGDQFDDWVGLNEYRLWQYTSTKPQRRCDFEYYDNHRGRDGDTTELKGCEGKSVHFVWDAEDYLLSNIHVSEGWKGETDTGLKIGDSLDDFLNAYPGAVSEGDSVFSDGEQFRVYTDPSNERILAMEVYAKP